MAIKVLTGAEKKARAARNREARERGEEVKTSDGRKGWIAKYGGARTKLTPELLDKILEIVAWGNFPHTAAMANMVPRKTWDEWMSKGRKGVEPYASAYIQVQSVMQLGIAESVKRIKEAGAKGVWVADARFLESVAGADWMRTEKRVHEDGEDSVKTLQSELIAQRNKARQEAEEQRKREITDKAILEAPNRPLPTLPQFPKKLDSISGPITQIPGLETKAN